MENKKKDEFIAVIADTMSALFAQMCGTDAAPQSKQGAALLDNLAAEEQPPENVTSPETSDKVELLTIKECCETVKGLNEYTVRQLVKREVIPYVRAGRGKNVKVLIPKAALLNYLRGGGAG